MEWIDGKLSIHNLGFQVVMDQIIVMRGHLSLVSLIQIFWEHNFKADSLSKERVNLEACMMKLMEVNKDAVTEHPPFQFL